MRRTLLAIALLAAAAPAAAQDHGARVDRFIAALPPSTSTPDGADADADATETARLIAANPGKEAAIRTARATHATCMTAASSDMAMRSLRHAAALLTDAELDQLTAFYSGPDYQQLVAQGDKADMEGLAKRYPLKRFMEVTRQAMDDLMGDGMEAFTRCDAAAEKSLHDAGVKTD